MARKNFGMTLYDAVIDLGNIFGLGNLIDKTGTESPEKIYATMTDIINSHFDEMANLNNKEISKLNSILQDMAINAPSPAFRSKVDNIKRKLNKDLDLRNDISKRIDSGRELAKDTASQILNNSNRTAGWIKNDVNREINKVINTTQNSIKNKEEELKNEI